MEIKEAEKSARISALSQSIKLINKALFILDKAKFESQVVQTLGESPLRILINQRFLFALEKERLIKS